MILLFCFRGYTCKHIERQLREELLVPSGMSSWFFDSIEKMSKEITELVSLSSLLPPSQVMFQSHSLFKTDSASAGILYTAGAYKKQLGA